VRYVIKRKENLLKADKTKCEMNTR